MASDDRPLSPHLQIYKPQFTSVLSILHRLTGLALAAGTLLLVYWLMAGAAGPDRYAVAQGFIGSFLGRLLLFGWSFALFYHLLNGIRHLFWDAGMGFELKTAYFSGWLVVTGAGLATVVAWVAAYVVMGSL
ncbi:MAG: succinate dehydrogenase, cytochrome b556 subunit [Rhodospirillaceae bacterium]|jgi:succinate dehydrogenase / fumarate reductase, cytochrome b subunit|nr:succinate dehydrogenase, cytochrome b556 subunit [Rhodospirillaceae bacterium]MBT6119710.1 succinate dehydrogenase, cytochrome b556 subunit [Rhodospirillaceae bacterium]